nr:hypothetical protein [Tanacetum cinerariifolium]
IAQVVLHAVVAHAARNGGLAHAERAAEAAALVVAVELGELDAVEAGKQAAQLAVAHGCYFRFVGLVQAALAVAAQVQAYFVREGAGQFFDF